MVFVQTRAELSGDVYCRQHLYQKIERSDGVGDAAIRAFRGREKGDQKREKQMPYNDIKPLHHQHQQKNKRSVLSKALSKLARLVFCCTNPTSDRRSSSKEIAAARPSTSASTAVVDPYTISPQTRARYTKLLAAELNKPISQADEAGYIYIYELQPSKPHDRANLDANALLFLKIGRTVNVPRRIEQWSRQCSHAVLLTGHFPSPPPPTAAHAKGAKCAAVHRAERLIHLDLRSRFACSATDEGFTVAACAGCGRRHTEWFAVRRRDAHLVVESIGRWVEYVGVVEM
ncbi:meiotically up-regulated gene 113-domain-containing protein [Myxozyma melibiosi]|uniref:Meiotically up-regulated gene 113-domain-containing protein n=1 Tax=Myxozyma melibiosi TaxID=54550 RepID=A0ABR1FAA3_9ASCO